MCGDIASREGGGIVTVCGVIASREGGGIVTVCGVIVLASLEARFALVSN